MDNNPYENQDKRVNNSVERPLALLKNKYQLVGETHIRAWHGFLVIGLVAGFASGIVLVANRSGQIEPGKAATDTVSLHSVELHDIAGTMMLKVIYSKNFDTCAHLYTQADQITHVQNYFCQMGERIAVTQPANLFSLIQVGTNVVLKHGNDPSIQSSTVTVVQSLPVSNKIPLYFSYHIGDIGDNKVPPFEKNNNHQWVDAAIISAKWRLSHIGPGTFDWTLLDKKIADWTGIQDPAGTFPPAKKVIIRVVPYGQDPLGAGYPSCPSCNDATPPWIYDIGVPKVTFIGGGEAGGKQVTVPQVWHRNFYSVYDEFLQELGKKYNNDKRVAGFSIGVGHIGTWNAQPSQKGSEAFQSPPFNWTLATWEAHIKQVMDSADEYLEKPLMVMAPPLFLENFKINETNAQTYGMAKRILEYATARHVSVLFSGLDPVKPIPNQFITPLVYYLATLTIPSDVTVGFTDDWPLWDSSPSGSTQGRTVEGFEKELKFVINLWSSINKKIPIFFSFLEPETCATNENPINTTYKLCLKYQQDIAAKDLHAITKKYLFVK